MDKRLSGESESAQTAARNFPGLLRTRAESSLRRRVGGGDTASALHDAQHALHELQVHQIELEMQNEELRRTQAALDVERARYFELYDLAPVGYCTLSAHGLIRQANLCLAAALDLPRTTLAKQRLSRFILDQDQDTYYLMLARLLKTTDTQSCDLRMVKRDATPFWMHVVATAAQDDGGEPVLRLALTDLTERRKAEQQRLHQLIELSREATVVMRDGKMVYVNPAAIGLFGAESAQQLMCIPMLDLVRTDFHRLAQQREQGLIEGAPVTPVYEEKWLKLGGTPMDLEVQRSRMVFDGTAAIQVALRDITRQKLIDRLLQDNNTELKLARSVADGANQAKSEFIASMSHELRSPLNSILGFTQLMEFGETTQVQKKNLAQILSAGGHLLGLINELLDLSLIESGKLKMELEPVALGLTLQECGGMIEMQAQGRGVSLSFQPLATPWYVHADPRRLRQVLLNLLSNAVKYNRAGGSVSVSCVFPDASSVRISITDSGIGMTPQQLGQLFQPFNRLGREGGLQEGSGLGLVVTRRLVELMEGSIGVHSEEGVGSCFWVELRGSDDALLPAPD
jgi:PAS domain S-box-containing protein